MELQQIDLQRNLFTINQEFLYTEQDITEAVTIIEVHNKNGNIQPTYAINLKGRRQFNTEGMHLSHLPEDKK